MLPGCSLVSQFCRSRITSLRKHRMTPSPRFPRCSPEMENHRRGFKNSCSKTVGVGSVIKAFYCNVYKPQYNISNINWKNIFDATLFRSFREVIESNKFILSPTFQLMLHYCKVWTGFEGVEEGITTTYCAMTAADFLVIAATTLTWY